jgi:hypothetical protein
MADVQQKPKLLTPVFRVAFPQIITAMVTVPGQKPRPAAPGEKGRYSIVALFDMAAIKADPKEKQKFDALVAAVNQACIDTFKRPMKELDRSVYKLPFHKGEEKSDYAGFGPGIIYSTFSAYTRPPGVANQRGQNADAAIIYPGCYARASVNPYAKTQWKSVSIGVNNLQFVRDGERLDGVTSAEEDFGSDPLEFADDGLGLDDATGGESDGEPF